jgi:hypothetical protein
VVARNVNEAMVAPVVGSDGVYIWRKSGIRSQAFGFVLVRLAGIYLASVAAKMFSHLVYFIKTFYTCCTSNTICKDNTAIHCITGQQKRLIPVKFDGSYARLLIFITLLNITE